MPDVRRIVGSREVERVTHYVSRRRTMGLSIGAVWLVVASAGFATWSLIAIGTALALSALAVVGAAVVGIAWWGITVARLAARLPNEPRGQQYQGVGRRFAWVVVVEVAAFSAVTTWGVMTAHFAMIPSLNLIVVGLHFLPLAKLFRVPRYYLMGVLFVAIPLATLLWFPEQAVVGATQSWYVLPSLGCGLAAAVTAAANLNEASSALGGRAGLTV